MSKKILLLGLVLLFLLAACNDDLSEADAEKGLRAALEGERGEAEKTVCDSALDSIGDATMPEGAALNISCKKDDDQMVCDVEASGLEEVEGGTATFAITFDVEDGKLCNATIPQME